MKIARLLCLIPFFGSIFLIIYIDRDRADRGFFEVNGMPWYGCYKKETLKYSWLTFLNWGVIVGLFFGLSYLIPSIRYYDNQETFLIVSMVVFLSPLSSAPALFYAKLAIKEETERTKERASRKSMTNYWQAIQEKYNLDKENNDNMTNKKYKNLIFDADGTLLDTVYGVQQSINYAMRKLGLPEFTKEQVLPFLGPSLMDTVINTLKFDEKMATKIVVLYREFYAKEGYAICELFPGVKELLFELKNRGYTLTLATNKAQPYIEKIMQEKEVLELFDGIYGQELGQFSSDKTPLVKKATAIAQPAIMVGDRFIDIIAAKNVGIDSIGVLWGSAEDGEFEEYEPTYVVEKPEDILKIVS